ncbi:MAG: T9SS type A sorting domain-containing protein [Saprospiraceae bacterium]
MVVVDTLAEWLDPASIELGAGSHPYTFEMSGSREEGGVILKFIFENIMLPDSNINELASHGFVKFHIAQMPDNPIGTRIENKAAIYFDFNEPIITNTAWHIIGEDFHPVVNSTDTKWQPNVSLDMAPNPYSTSTLIKLNGVDLGDFQIKIFDLTGRVLLEDPFLQNQYTLHQEELPNGVLTVGIYQNNLPVAFDKLVKIKP